MPMQEWIHKYPRVQALMQQETESLEYAPDEDRGSCPRVAVVMLDTPLSLAQITELIGAEYAHILVNNPEEGLPLCVGADGVVTNAAPIVLTGQLPVSPVYAADWFLIGQVGSMVTVLAQGQVESIILFDLDEACAAARSERLHRYSTTFTRSIV